MDRKIKQVDFPMAEFPKITRVAAYARVSDGKDAMLQSLSAQVSYYSRLIQNHSGWQYCGVYSDEAVTGTKETRADFQRLLDDCRKGKIDVIITKSISRFARNTVTLLETVRELKLLGIDVVFEEQNIHTLSAEGELMLTILASYAQEESLSVSENMKWRVRSKFQNGIPWNGTLLGYRIENNQYVIVEDEAEIIRTIYDLYLLGLGYEAIARELNERNIKTRNGNDWTHSSVLWILHNYSYTGNLLLQRTYTENHLTKKYRFNKGEFPMYHAESSHQPIISLEMFNAVQAEAAERARKFSKVENKNTTELTGRVFCGNCGKRCRRKIRHGTPIWICNTYNSQGKGACAAKAVPESVLLNLDSRYNVKCFILCNDNKVIVKSDDDSEIIETWADNSRTDSWTAEKKKLQSERMKESWRKREK